MRYKSRVVYPRMVQINPIIPVIEPFRSLELVKIVLVLIILKHGFSTIRKLQYFPNGKIPPKNNTTVLQLLFCRLLTNSCVSLSSEVETPTFYQTLAGVTHLEEHDICELEKCFWSLQSSSLSGQLDLNCIGSLVGPPIPTTACQG